MKLIPLIFILSAISLNVALGQDYQTISENRISYFQGQYIKCLRIDSVRYQSDSVFYPFRVIQHLDENCYSPFVASWIGAKIIVRENGMNLFLNRGNDTIKINTRAKLNDKWIAFDLADSIIIEATVTNHDTMSFLGLVDSVKTLSFQVYDTSMSPLDYDINQMNLHISKNYGFIKTFNFYLFPDITVDFPPDQFEELDLIGLSNPKTGVQNLTWFDVNDFEPGDELHILDESSSWYGDGSGHAITNKAMYKYLDRTDYEDSIVYHYSRRQSIFTTWSDSSSFKFYNDTLKEIIKPDTLFDKLPGEPIVFSDFSMFNYVMTKGPILSKEDPSDLEWYFHSSDSCWFMPITDGCLSVDTYLQGLGGPYYSCINAFSLGGAERKLVYYKKGETEWGSPLVITQVSDPVTYAISVFPNPAKDFITISLQGSHAGKLKFTMFDLNGRIVINEIIDASEKLINIAAVTPGVYLYRLTEPDRIVYLNKIVIDR